MNNICWVGLNESEIEYSNNCFMKSITLNGNSANNVSYSQSTNIRINYNIDSKEIGEFYYEQLNKVLKDNPNVRFMFYNPFIAYYYGEKIISKTICLNSFETLKTLKNKIYMRNLFEQLNIGRILPHIELIGSKILYQYVCNMFNNDYKEFVVQAENSDGGNSTFLYNEINCNNQNFDKNQIYSISPYIRNSISINTNIIVYDEEICMFPPSIQIIVNKNNCLLYKGADYIAYKKISNKINEKLTYFNKQVSDYLQEIGFRGICGIDCIYDGNDIYFMEINERFQSSTYLLNMELSNHNYPSIQEMCIDAFSGKHFSYDFSDFNVNLSNYAYSNDIDVNINDKLNRIQGDQSIYKIVLDGYSKNLILQERAYLFKTIYNTNICGISPDNTVYISNNIVGLSNFNISNKIDVKIALICCGIFVTDMAKQKIEEEGGTCLAVNRGLNLTIFDDVTVICLTQDFNGVYQSPFSLDINNNKNYVLKYNDEFVSLVNLQIKEAIMKKKTSSGVHFSKIATLALDRVGINYQPLCTYKVNGIPCKFCNLPSQSEAFSLNDIYEVIDAYLDNVDFRHFLIGGATSNSADDYDRILKISKYISKKCNKPIYLMSLPIDDEEKLIQLKNNGITEVAFNIEVFNRDIAKTIMPGKGYIKIDKYFYALKKAVNIWNEPESVRSMIVVGLEPKDSLIKGIEQLAQMGVSPILSPFGPAKGCEMENELPENYEYFKEIYEKAVNICSKYNIKLGPKCNYCKNNALAINEF